MQTHPQTSRISRTSRTSTISRKSKKLHPRGVGVVQILFLLLLGMFAAGVVVFFVYKKAKDPSAPAVSPVKPAKPIKPVEPAAPNTPTPVAAKAALNIPASAWVDIPAGSVHVGCVEGDADCLPEEKDSNRYAASVNAFRLMKTEVTAQAYQECVKAGICTEARKNEGSFVECTTGVAGKEDHPINCVSWLQAETYCRAAGGRLPTVAEFEYVLRAGQATPSIYPWGNKAADACVWGNVSDQTHAEKHNNGVNIACKDGYEYTAPVGKFRANAFGVFDLTGNVFEWTSDAFVDRDLQTKETPNPNPKPEDIVREFRGGAFLSYASNLRASYRYHDRASSDLLFVGFRCAQ